MRIMLEWDNLARMALSCCNTEKFVAIEWMRAIMQPHDIGKAYDELTHLWESEKFNLDNGLDAHKRALSFRESKGYALDVGCGLTGRFARLLLERGYAVEGLDVSSRMIDLAHKRMPEMVLHHADICTWQPSKQYQFITAWDSLWHLPLQSQPTVMRKLAEMLAPGGVLILSFGGTESAGEHLDSTMGPEMYYSTLGTNELLTLFIENGCECRHLEFDHVPERHTFVIVQKPGVSTLVDS